MNVKYIQFRCSPTNTDIVCMVSLDHSHLSQTVAFNIDRRNGSDKIRLECDASPNSLNYYPDKIRPRVNIYQDNLLMFYFFVRDSGCDGYTKVAVGYVELQYLVENKSSPVELTHLFDPYGYVVHIPAAVERRKTDPLKLRNLLTSLPLSITKEFKVTLISTDLPATPIDKIVRPSVKQHRHSTPTVVQAEYDNNVDELISATVNKRSIDGGFTWYYNRNSLNRCMFDISFLLFRTSASNEAFWLNLLDRIRFLKKGKISDNVWSYMMVYYAASSMSYSCDFIEDDYMEGWICKKSDCEDYCVCILQLFKAFTEFSGFKDSTLISAQRNANKYIAFFALHRAKIRPEAKEEGDFGSHVNTMFVPKKKVLEMISSKSTKDMNMLKHLEQFRDDPDLDVLMGEATSYIDPAFDPDNEHVKKDGQAISTILDGSGLVRGIPRGITRTPYHYVIALYTSYFIDKLIDNRVAGFTLTSNTDNEYGVPLGMLTDVDCARHVSMIQHPIIPNQLIQLAVQQSRFRPQAPSFIYDSNKKVFTPFYVDQTAYKQLKDVGEYERRVNAVFKKKRTKANAEYLYSLIIPDHMMRNDETIDSLSTFFGKCAYETKITKLNNDTLVIDMHVYEE
jgi:hypothetical protein